MSEEVRIHDEERVRWLEIDRPASKNGLTNEVNQRLIDGLREAGTRDDVRVVVITGAGGSFCSGLDLKAFGAQGVPSREQLEANMRTYFHALIRAIREVPVPTIAAVDGAAAGFGCDLALACDLRLVSERARFGEIFVRRGLMPDGGGTHILPRLVGVARALELMYTGEMIDAETAVRIGLANRLYATHEHHGEVKAFAERLARGPSMVHRLIKESVYASLESGLDAALERELTGQMQCLQSPDFAEGVAAFLGKRDPQFK